MSEVETLRTALRMILASPFGCPMCDSGILRKSAKDAGKDHWETCGFRAAEEALRPAPQVDDIVEGHEDERR